MKQRFFALSTSHLFAIGALLAGLGLMSAGRAFASDANVTPPASGATDTSPAGAPADSGTATDTTGTTSPDTTTGTDTGATGAAGTTPDTASPPPQSAADPAGQPATTGATAPGTTGEGGTMGSTGATTSGAGAGAGINPVAGNNVMDNVDDVRGRVENLVQTISSRGAELNVPDWSTQSATWTGLVDRIKAMGERDRNAAPTTAIWKTQVSDELGSLASALDQVRTFLVANTSAGQTLGNNIVEGVKGVRNDVRDLIQDLKDNGQQLGFTDWQTRSGEFDPMLRQLSDMETVLNQKWDVFDEARSSDLTRVIGDLSSMLQRLSQSLTRA